MKLIIFDGKTTAFRDVSVSICGTNIILVKKARMLSAIIFPPSNEMPEVYIQHLW